MIKSRSTSIVLALIIFLVGIACGLLFDRLIPFCRMYPRLRGEQKFRGQKIPERLSVRFSEELDLSEEQRGKLLLILDKYKMEMEKLRKESRPKFKELRDSMKEEIKSILNDKQKEKFIRMTEKEKKREQRFENRIQKKKEN